MMIGDQLFLEFISLDEIDRIEAERAGQIVLFSQNYHDEDLPIRNELHHKNNHSLFDIQAF